ncbi:mitochondrial carrier domain-containing protein [Mycena olivaceomarginata]|nr:mitochondrial carrier domain-containing protein [Mycena olivaceomarginata]
MFATHIATGRIARGCESLACQPLNTIKVRMQLSKSGCAPGGPLALYKGLGAVLSSIVPKIAIRFGTTEVIAVVTPMEVVKIRLQAQMRSLADPLEIPGIGTRDMRCILSRTNQGTYQEIKKFCAPDAAGLKELPSYQHMLIGLISGAMDPFSNAPIDTIKTRTSAKAPATEGASAFERIASIAHAMWRPDGPRLMNSTSMLIARGWNTRISTRPARSRRLTPTLSRTSTLRASRSQIWRKSNEREKEKERWRRTGVRPYVLRQRQKINYAIPPPLEEMTCPPATDPPATVAQTHKGPRLERERCRARTLDGHGLAITSDAVMHKYAANYRDTAEDKEQLPPQPTTRAACSGKPPFSGVSPDVAAMLKVVAGERPPRPATMSDRLWGIATAAWVQKYLDRPAVKEIVEYITTTAESDNLQTST